MTDRLTVDTITSDQLAALQLRAARMEHATKQAAEVAVRLEDAEAGITAAIRQRKEQEDRALRAEHALVRVHHVAAAIHAGAPWTANRQETAARIRAAIAEPEATDGQSITKEPKSPAPHPRDPFDFSMAPAVRDAIQQATCDAYQLPTTPAESGVCARCGMYDWRHQTAWTPPPPGDRREQLPDHLLTAISNVLGKYYSTACHTATACQAAAYQHTELADELRTQAQRLHTRCRLNQKFTGQHCVCGCHSAKERQR